MFRILDVSSNSMTPTIERTYYPSGHVKTEYYILNGQKNGKHTLYHENGRVAIEANYLNGKNEGAWTEWYENGQIAEEGFYKNGEYKVVNFWTEDGIELLKEGTGTVIRKYGTYDSDVYEVYFENGHFKGEKKIKSLIFLGFKPDTQH